MKSRKERLVRSRVYAILDKETCFSNSLDLKRAAKGLLGAGIDIIQLRDKRSKKKEVLKDALRLHKILKGRKALFIINDYPDIAKIIDCDGVHLGQDDLSIESARGILGADKIIGKSCHTLKQAVIAEKEGADYIGVGPIFPTPTKPGYKAKGLRFVRQAADNIRIPFFVIGGIDETNLGQVCKSGAKRIAACRPFLKKGNLKKQVIGFKKALGNT